RQAFTKEATAMEFKLPPATHVSKFSVLMTTVTARKSGMSHLNFARAVKGTSAGVVTLFTNARNATVVSHAMNARKTYRARPKTVRMVLTILIVQTALTRSYFGCLVARNMFVTVAVAMLVIAAESSGHLEKRKEVILTPSVSLHLAIGTFMKIGHLKSVEGATSRIGRNDHTNLGFSSLPPRTSDAAFEVQGRQRRRRERRLTPLQRTTDRGRTGPPGTPARNVTRYAALGSLD
ncbi:hypothetical protein THAOC_29730, partial [Thalassiosira oceanica]